MLSAQWRQNNHDAQLIADDWQARLSLDELFQGLREVRFKDIAVPRMSLMVLALPGGAAKSRLVDCYVRGTDLIATVEIADAPVLRLELHYRLHPGAAELSLDLQVSVQTPLGDVLPELEVATLLTATQTMRLKAATDPTAENAPFDPLPAGQSFHCDEPPGTILARLEAPSLSYAQMVHPSDFSGVAVESVDAGTLRIGHRLFHEHLEKGVIRRARVRGLFCQRQEDQGRVAARYRAFADEEPDLSS
jgi:hypothetical protein